MWLIPLILITAGIGTVIAIAATVGEDTSPVGAAAASAYLGRR